MLGGTSAQQMTHAVKLQTLRAALMHLCTVQQRSSCSTPILKLCQSTRALFLHRSDNQRQRTCARHSCHHSASPPPPASSSSPMPSSSSKWIPCSRPCSHQERTVESAIMRSGRLLSVKGSRICFQHILAGQCTASWIKHQTFLRSSQAVNKHPGQHTLTEQLHDLSSSRQQQPACTCQA